MSLNNNSPEGNLRGIEFSAEALLNEEYGYQIDDSVPFSWKDPTGASVVTLSSADDGFAGPIPMGFVFPFYEGTYSEVYISANGFVTFAPIEGFNGAQNQEIPYEIVPNNVVAPFWSDLAVGGSFNDGLVSTMQGSDGLGQYFAINYLNISKRYSTSDLLTFQIILYQNGDVWFQYSTLTGNLDATVGLEDGDGLSGVLYPSLLTNGLAIRLQRPGDSARVKWLSVLESGLTQSGVRDFPVQIRNTGELGGDTYEIEIQDEGTGKPNWELILMNEDGEELSDADNDGAPETSLISQGDTITITARVQTPAASIVGDHASFNLTATSSLDEEKQDEVRILAAVPSRHFIAFGNSAGLDLGRITTARQIVFDVTDFGEYPSLALAGNQYFYTWENSFRNPGTNPGTDIEYAVLGYGGNPIKLPTKLTSGVDDDFLIRDFSPAIAISPDNRVGIVWVRRIIDPTQLSLGENYNVFWALLDSNGNVLVPPTSITTYEPDGGFCQTSPEFCWQDGDNIDVPVYSSPMIMATPDNRFFISWIDGRILDGGTVTDIGFAVYASTGDVLNEADDLKNGNTAGEEYSSPRLLALPNERMMVAYTVFNPDTNLFTPAYGLYSTNPFSLGEELQGDVLLEGTQGRYSAQALLANARILMAWTNPNTEQISFTILSDDGTFVTANNPIVDFQTPDGRESNFVSVTATSAGQGILSWFDAKAATRVYYALVATDGSVITPPMIAWEDTETISVSQTGQGIVAIPDWRTLLPIIQR